MTTTLSSFSFLNGVRFAPQIGANVGVINPDDLKRAKPTREEVNKHEPSRHALSVKFEKTLKGDVFFQCSDNPNQLLKVATPVLPYVSMTLARMVEACSMINNASNPLPIQNLTHNVLEFIIAVAQMLHATLSTLQSWPSKQVYENLSEIDRDVLRNSYENAIVGVVGNIHSMQVTFFKRALDAEKARVIALSVGDFAKHILKQEEGRLVSQLRSLYARVTNQTRAELTRNAQKANTQLSWQKAQDVISGKLKETAEQRYTVEKAALEAKFKDEFTPKLHLALSNPDKRKIFYVNALRHYWRELFCTILQTVGAYYENRLIMLAFGLKMAQTIEHKITEEIRRDWDIVNDFTPEHYEQLKKENQWLENV